MKRTINGYTYDTRESKKLAISSWQNFPHKGDNLNSALYKDDHGKYFVLEEYSWFREKLIVPKTKTDAELYYLYANKIFPDF